MLVKRSVPSPQYRCKTDSRGIAWSIILHPGVEDKWVAALKCLGTTDVTYLIIWTDIQGDAIMPFENIPSLEYPLPWCSSKTHNTG